MKYLIMPMLIILIGCNVESDLVNDRTMKKLCLEGHVYFISGQQLANKLNDDGTPVKCGSKVK